jgi:uncharacterized protein
MHRNHRLERKMKDSKLTVKTPGMDVPWHQVTLFSVLAYALSWLFWGPRIVPHLGLLLTTAQTAEEIGAILGPLGAALGMFGPMIAAILMRLFVSKEGLKGSLGLRRSWKYCAIATISPALFVGLVILFNHATGLGRFVWSSEKPLWLIYPLTVLGGILGLPFAFGEEYGWRGYLLPRLLPLGELKASVIVGLIWAFWHLPILLVGLNYPGQNPFLVLSVFTFTVLMLAFPFTWLYVASGGSVLVVAVLHATFNIYVDTFTELEYIPNGNPLVVDGTGLVAALFLLGMVVIVYNLLRRRVNARKAGLLA